jgi:hypothetical protein
MRTLVVAIAIFGLIAVAAHAADDSPASQDKLSSVVGKLPDTEDKHQQVYLFTLKKNGISLKMGGDEFCAAMKYGKAVYFQPTAPTFVEGKPVRGELEWVICRMSKK